VVGFGPGWGWGGPGWGWGPGWAWGYGGYGYGPGWYPSPYAYPQAVIQQQPQQYIEQPVQQQQPGDGYWYYCQSAGGYYPRVPNCAEPWVKVPPVPE
jgi:hypothetical protein